MGQGLGLWPFGPEGGYGGQGRRGFSEASGKRANRTDSGRLRRPGGRACKRSRPRFPHASRNSGPRLHAPLQGGDSPRLRPRPGALGQKAQTLLELSIPLPAGQEPGRQASPLPTCLFFKMYCFFTFFI